MTAPARLETALVLLAVAAASLFRVPGSPMIMGIASGVSLDALGVFGGAPLPEAVRDGAYALIGIHVGLKFTLSSLKDVGRSLPLATAQTLVTIALCSAVGVVCAPYLGLSQLDAYLSTTPGGLYAVIAVAIATGDDPALTISMQVLRVLAALAVVPVLAAVFGRRAKR